ncbi:colicin immunity domain-containing protein [Streptomyces megasporus]|uniref:colicin immunity domain-containing protein n=1 Tax=Streptomyces megasporus TaxID=44060 RepID=UPI001FDF71F1|nr:colicin immunity domain-containing protein [Streptomyces megasporus]
MTREDIRGAKSGDADGSEVLSGRESYREQWLSKGPKIIVPVPAGSHVSRDLIRRMVEGCRAVGEGNISFGSTEKVPSERIWDSTSLETAASHLDGFAPPVLLATANLQGAILFPGPGYALVAGTKKFLQRAVPEGVDEGRVRFAHYARAVDQRRPELRVVAHSFPARNTSWSRAQDIPSETGASRQVELMHAFVAGDCTGAEFARGWLEARRLSQNNGERLRNPLATAFDRVFSLLEDYSIDPDLKDPEDLSDDELKRAVQDLMKNSQAFD